MTDLSAHLDQIAAWLAASDIEVLELRGPGTAIRLVRTGAAVRSESLPAGEADDGRDAAGVPPVLVTSAGVGVFLDRHPLDLEPCVTPGAPCAAGSPLGFLRVGPLLRAVAAPVDGIVGDVLALHGDVVGFGSPLVSITPLGGPEEP